MITDEQHPQNSVDYYEDLTGKISEPTEDHIEEIGMRIKNLREKKGLSISELSNLTGFDEDRLTRIESGKLQPQLGTVMKLSKALDSAFGRILSGEGEKLYSITRKDEQKAVFRSTSVKDGKSLYNYKSLAPEVKGRHMESFVVELKKSEEKETSVHEGEEFIYVLSGKVLLSIDEKTHELEPGDSAYYLSTTPHLLTSADENSTILAVVYG